MAFWRRITQSKLRHFSSQFKRTYLQIPHASSLNNISTYTRTSVAEKQYWDIPKRASDFCNNMRPFSARSQSKSTDKEKQKPRMNEQITNQFVRLVTEEGHTVISINEALRRARELQLDLVEVGALVDPPACKLLDLKREKYLQQQRKKELKKKSESTVTLRGGTLKEVRFNRKIEQNDLNFKADQVKRLIERGYRVKCLATVPATYDMERRDLVEFEDQSLEKLITRFSDLIEDVATVESDHRTKGKQAFLIVRHSKFGPLKSGKKVTVAGKTVDPEAADPSEEHSILDEENPDSDVSETTPLPAKTGAPKFQKPRQVANNPSPGMNPSPQRKPSFETENRYGRKETPSTNPSPQIKPPIETENRYGRKETPSTNPSPQIKPPIATENRYGRNETSNRYAPRSPGPSLRDSSGFRPNDRRQPGPDSNFNKIPGGRDSGRYEPQFPDQRRQSRDPSVDSGQNMRNSAGFQPPFTDQRRQQQQFDPNVNGDSGVRDSVRFDPRAPTRRR